MATLKESLLENILAGKGVIRAGKGAFRVGQDFSCHLILWLFLIYKNIKLSVNFNGVYSRNNVPKLKYGPYVINLDEYKSIGTHWIVLYVNCDNVTYFDSFEVE